MTSENLRKIAADSNVILSAVMGKAALRIIVHPEIQIITTQFNLLEVEEYLPQLASKYRLSGLLLAWQLTMLPMRIFYEKDYEAHLSKAQNLLKNRDRDDAHLLALALKEKTPIWSNDKDFKPLSSMIPVYTTAQLLKLIGV